MNALSSCALADLSIDITWKNKGITHQEHYFVKNLNCWRDAFPGSPVQKIMDDPDASPLFMDVPPGTLVPGYDPGKMITLPASRLNGKDPAYFRKGRFYPQGLLSGVPGVFKANMTPFRCIASDANGMTADLNHPMAGYPFTLSLRVLDRSSSSEERGGVCVDWLAEALTGPGMQAAYDGLSTDFFAGRAFDRRDESADPAFYATDRLVHHIDATASQNLSDIYHDLIPPGAIVLDLMAGLDSHLPDGLGLQSVHGLGLNANEMSANRQLNDFSIQDLNAVPHLSFPDQTFDTVICALSVEYLVRPSAVFEEVLRVLKPGGNFIVTFSNRWFPEKAIRIWEDLHDFERMGLVIDYFKKSMGWTGMSTLTKRGYPRPADDKYYPELRHSDPIYAVTATKGPGDSHA